MKGIKVNREDKQDKVQILLIYRRTPSSKIRSRTKSLSPCSQLELIYYIEDLILILVLVLDLDLELERRARSKPYIIESIMNLE
jgi:hypothetical protein